MSHSTRVTGHGLRKEGSPYHLALCSKCEDDARENGSWNDEHGPRAKFKEGHGLCACGALSTHLEGDRTRQRWHRKHKSDVREGLV